VRRRLHRGLLSAMQNNSSFELFCIKGLLARAAARQRRPRESPRP
jgi:hypothetical protein